MADRKRILVVAPHPDDEVLGCGATMRRWANEGAEIAVCIVTKAYTPERTEEFIRERPTQVAKAAEILGATKTYFLDFPTVKLDTISQRELNDALARVIKEYAPDTLYIPHCGDINVDHQIVHRAALVASRPVPGQSVQAVYAYETLSETEWGDIPFVPTAYVNVEKTMDAKLAAMSVYKSEVREFPHPRSLEAIGVLAKKRGAEVGVPAAEGFMVLRELRA